MHRETVWEFKTRKFRVTLDIAQCEDDPRDSFSFDEDIEAVENGRVEWFNAYVTVYGPKGVEVAQDSLHCCAYATIREFYTSHRDRDPMNRNSSIMRAARGSNVTICHYFPDMVSEAIGEARKFLANLKSVKLRKV